MIAYARRINETLRSPLVLSVSQFRRVLDIFMVKRPHVSGCCLIFRCEARSRNSRARLGFILTIFSRTMERGLYTPPRIGSARRGWLARLISETGPYLLARGNDGHARVYIDPHLNYCVTGTTHMPTIELLSAGLKGLSTMRRLA